jgi:hypothetical protein
VLDHRLAEQCKEESHVALGRAPYDFAHTITG